MQQMDLVCNGDAKISCETIAAPLEPPDSSPQKYLDFPPESHVLKVGEEIDWVNLNAVYDRDDSTKGNTNPKAQQVTLSKPRSNSQRFSGNLKPKGPPIIGLPGTIQYSGYLSRSSRRLTNARIFPKKPLHQGSRKSAVPDDEPASPKVSCIGKVLSQRERDRCRKQCKDKKNKKNSAEEGVVTAGCWAGFAAAFCFRGGGERVDCDADKNPTSPPVKALSKAGKRSSREEEEEMEGPATNPPGLGAMKRFASGRKAATWCEDAGLCASARVDLELEEDGGHVAWSGPLDREAGWRRRSFGSLEEERVRNRDTQGSESI